MSTEKITIALIGKDKPRNILKEKIIYFAQTYSTPQQQQQQISSPTKPGYVLEDFLFKNCLINIIEVSEFEANGPRFDGTLWAIGKKDSLSESTLPDAELREKSSVAGIQKFMSESKSYKGADLHENPYFCLAEKIALTEKIGPTLNKIKLVNIEVVNITKIPLSEDEKSLANDVVHVVQTSYLKKNNVSTNKEKEEDIANRVANLFIDFYRGDNSENKAEEEGMVDRLTRLIQNHQFLAQFQAPKEDSELSQAHSSASVASVPRKRTLAWHQKSRGFLALLIVALIATIAIFGSLAFFKILVTPFIFIAIPTVLVVAAILLIVKIGYDNRKTNSSIPVEVQPTVGYSASEQNNQQILQEPTPIVIQSTAVPLATSSKIDYDHHQTNSSRVTDKTTIGDLASEQDNRQTSQQSAPILTQNTTGSRESSLKNASRSAKKLKNIFRNNNTTKTEELQISITFVFENNGHIFLKCSESRPRQAEPTEPSKGFTDFEIFFNGLFPNEEISLNHIPIMKILELPDSAVSQKENVFEMQ